MCHQEPFLTGRNKNQIILLRAIYKRIEGHLYLRSRVGWKGDVPHALSQLCDLLAGSIGVGGEPQLNFLQVLVSNDRQPSVCHMTQYDGTETEDLSKSGSIWSDRQT